MSRGWRLAAFCLRAFAFGLIALLALVVLYTPELCEAFGAGSWGASLLPATPGSLMLWLLITTFNAGAAFYLAQVLDG